MVNYYEKSKICKILRPCSKRRTFELRRLWNVQLKTAKLQRKNEAMKRAIQKYEENQEEGI